MSNSLDKLVSVLQKSLLETEDRKPKPYDTPAEVRRVEGSIAYVHIPGGVDETPVKLTSSADIGDEILVRVANGSAWGIGNSTNPPTDDRVAIKAQTTADGASKIAGEAFNSANAAKMAADYANEQAEVARSAADLAKAIADELEESVDSLNTRVTTAEGDITTVEGNISSLNTRVTTAQSNISTLQQDVSDAQNDIDDAIEGIALAENVIGTINWLTAHSTITDDTTPVVGKSYYIKHQDGTFEIVTDTTGKNPHQQGWYEMDSAISNYVGAHLALTNYGLNLTLDNNSYRIHIGTLTASGDDGVYVIDENGNVVTYFGESISFDSSYPFHIGNQNNYILWNPAQNRIEIGGNVMMGGSKTLSEVLAEIDATLVYDHTFSISNGVATFIPHVYQGGEEVTTNYAASCFTWKYRLISGSEVALTTKSDRGCDVTITNLGYGGHVIGMFTPT